MVVCVVLAGLSLLVHATPGFDPWAWLVWGRQLAHFELDTGAGLSWKPLPVLFTTAFAPFGDAAPALWLLVARTGGLLAVAATYRLAARFGGAVAGAVATGALLLTPGSDARFLRLLAQGNIEPLVAATCLWAIDRHLAGRPRQAFVLAVVGGLARPELWPFAALYGLWLWRRDAVPRTTIVGLLAAIPLLWFGGDALGSGSALTGAQTASVIANNPGHRLVLALQRIGAMVVLPVWGAALAMALAAYRRRWVEPLLLAIAALGWTTTVLLMTVVFGYAALGRFLLPAAAVLCVLAGVGAAVALRAPRGRAARIVVALVLVAATIPFAVPRGIAVAEQASVVAARARLDDDLDRVVSLAGGPERIRANGDIALELDAATLAAWPALAWKLGVPLRDIGGDHRVIDGGTVVAHRDGDWQRALAAAAESRTVHELARSDQWVVLTVDGGEEGDSMR
ncbi:MAG: hypothetical protein WD080_11210 [Egibacteraceae bacterium]